MLHTRNRKKIIVTGGGFASIQFIEHFDQNFIGQDLHEFSNHS